MKLGQIAVLGIALTLGSCSGEQIESATSLAEESHSVTKRVTKEEFKAALTSLENIQLVDVRTPGEFEGGSMEDAVNIDYNGSDFETQIGNLDKTKPTLIFCHAGGRSAQALDMMRGMGFEHVLELEGGYSNW